MLKSLKILPPGKSIYFASDFHLGAPNQELSRKREARIVQWITAIEDHAAALVLAGDTFDFWFEYRHAVPRGFVRLLGKLASLADRGIPVFMFTGNHDMWMFEYLKEETGATIFYGPQVIESNGKSMLVGHGDGLGPGDFRYKLLKSVFSNKLCQWAFARLHPNLGIGIARKWSRYSRVQNNSFPVPAEDAQDFILNYCMHREESEHFDYYIFGHRHLPVEKRISENSTYINLGDWLNDSSYAVYDGDSVRLLKFDHAGL